MNHYHHESHEAPGAPDPASAPAHERHAGHSVAMFRDKFWISLALTVPAFAWSPEVQHWFGFKAPAFPGSTLIPAAAGTIIFFYGGLVFLRGARSEFADRKPGMMTLISLAIVVAYVASLAALFGLLQVDVWWELSSLITIMVLGHWIEMRAISSARGALNAVAALLPDTAERIEGSSVQPVRTADLRIDDLVLVRPGARVPADGQVVEGSADVDESILTGESKPISKSPGSTVIAGAVAAGGSLRVRVTAVGDRTALAGIMRLVAAAQASSSRAQALADRAAAILFYIAVASGAATFLYWWLTGDKQHALIRASTVLVIACPHALGLAIPLVIAISTALGAQNGLLVKDRLALERARNLNLVIFDKTGTLTKGVPVISALAAVDGSSENEFLAMAAAVEANSEHPLAKAVVNHARQKGLDPLVARDFAALPGQGAKADVGGRPIIVGGPRLLGELKTNLPAAINRFSRDSAAEGKTILYVIADGRVAGALAAEDEIRPESIEAVTELHRLGVRVAMITGDSSAVANSVARRVAIDDVVAEVLPGEKAAAVQQFQERGKLVAMVGDGVNDAPALATADVGIAIGAGTDVAIESAGIVLVRNDPRDVIGAIRLSRASYRKMVQNLVWATAYNLLAIPAAAGVLVPFGIDLPMSIGAVAMSLSTIIVAANAQLLRRLNLRASRR
jgi:Cu2+-exporting ATPase